MYDLQAILTTFWDRKYLTFYPSVDQNKDVLDYRISGTPKSGLYFNQGTHQYLHNWSNILSCLELTQEFEFDYWDVADTYAKDRIVYDGGSFFKSCKADNIGNATTDTAWWKTYSGTTIKPVYLAASTYAKDAIVYNGAAYYISQQDANTGNDVTDDAWWKVTTLEAVLLMESVNNTIQQLLAEVIVATPLAENRELIAVQADEDIIPNNGSFVGFAFRANCTEHLSMVINSIGIHTTGNATITFNLWNQTTEVKTFSIAHTGEDMVVYNLDTDTLEVEMKESKGWWYLWYDQADLGSDSAKGKDVYIDPYFNELLDLYAFKVSDTADINDWNKMDYTNAWNYGLSLNISLGFDLTQFIKDHLRTMVPAIKYAWAMEMLNCMLYNPNAKTNREQRNVNENTLKFDLKGDPNTGRPFWLTAHNEKKKLKNSLKGLHDAAFIDNKTNNYEIR